MQISQTEGCVDDERERIEFLRPLHLHEFSLSLTGVSENRVTKPVMCSCVVRVQLDRAFELRLASSVVELVNGFHVTKRRVCVRRSFIQTQRFARCVLSLWKTLQRRAAVVSRQQNPGLRCRR